MSAPQVIAIVILSMGLAIQVLLHGQKHPPYNGWRALLGCAVTVALLWWGGFWG